MILHCYIIRRYTYKLYRSCRVIRVRRKYNPRVVCERKRDKGVNTKFIRAPILYMVLFQRRFFRRRKDHINHVVVYRRQIPIVTIIRCETFSFQLCTHTLSGRQKKKKKLKKSLYSLNAHL